MGIIVKTRKILWSKAGNRCAFCKKLLVQRIDIANADLIIGEECHIISSKAKGPRGNILKMEDFDIYENLILLCANDHKLIDDFPETFTYEIIVNLKSNHEKWIDYVVDKELNESWKRLNNLEELEEITSSEVLDKIINSSHFYLFDSSYITEYQVLIEINGIFDDLKDISDIYQDISLTQRTIYLLEKVSLFEQLKAKGISFFGTLITKNLKVLNLPIQPYRISLIVAHTGQINDDSLKNGKLYIQLPDEIIPSF